MTPNSLLFNVSFESLDDPSAISLTSSTVQDSLIVQVPKNLILNGQDGESLVLDSDDFDEEDASNYFLSASLQPQQIQPTSATTANLQAAADAGPAVAGAVQVGSLATALLTGAPSVEMGENMAAEQQSAAGSAMKVI